MSKLKVLLAQLSPKLGDPDHNLERALELLGEPDLAVFPELYLSGYYSKDLLYRMAINPWESPLVEKLREAVEKSGTAVVMGFPEKSGHKIMYNSALAINESGEVLVYRKRHLPTFSVFDEYRWFRAHRGRLRTWRFKGIEAGIAICYDIFFPEIFRSYTLMGAKLLIVLSAVPDSSLKFFETLSEARAMENTSYFIWVNQVGVFDGVGFAGGSRIISPLGGQIDRCRLMDEEAKIVEIDLEEIERARKVRPLLRDLHREDGENLLEAYLTFEEE